jgi:hypothetical protein
MSIWLFIFKTDQAQIYSVKTKRARKRGKVKRGNRGKREKDQRKATEWLFDGRDDVKWKSGESGF